MPGMQGLESALYLENDQKLNDRISSVPYPHLTPPTKAKC